MNRPMPEPVQVIKQRREAVLARLAGGIPWVGFLGLRFQRLGDELTGILPYQDKLIGNPMLPALHGGGTAAFMETVAIMQLAWTNLWEGMETGTIDALDLSHPLPPLPKTIDFTVDYLRTGLPRDAYARARVNRSGRRFASVQVTGWQDHHDRPFIQATAHFLMPEP